MCVGTASVFTDPVTGGTWVSSNTSVATIDGATGHIVAGAAGTTTITYTTGAGCVTTQTETVNAAASSGTIYGHTTVIVADTTTLYDDIPGGTWTSSNTSVATVDTFSGLVTGVAAGTALISYTVDNGCGPVSGTYPMTVSTSRAGGNNAVSVQQVDATIYPNPNKGDFAIVATTGANSDADVYLEVTDMLGQIIYRNHLTAVAGKLNQNIQLNNDLANGMYTLKVQMADGQKVIHFMISK
jgi:uncharacterized protein YjdB